MAKILHYKEIYMVTYDSIVTVMKAYLILNLKVMRRTYQAREMVNELLEVDALAFQEQ